MSHPSTAVTPNRTRKKNPKRQKTSCKGPNQHRCGEEQGPARAEKMELPAHGILMFPQVKRPKLLKVLGDGVWGDGVWGDGVWGDGVPRLSDGVPVSMRS